MCHNFIDHFLTKYSICKQSLLRSFLEKFFSIKWIKFVVDLTTTSFYYILLSDIAADIAKIMGLNPILEPNFIGFLLALLVIWLPLFWHKYVILFS